MNAYNNISHGTEKPETAQVPSNRRTNRQTEGPLYNGVRTAQQCKEIEFGSTQHDFTYCTPVTRFDMSLCPLSFPWTCS